MLATLSTGMHDHGFHGPPMLIGNSPPHPQVPASHGLMSISQESPNCKNSTCLDLPALSEQQSQQSSGQNQQTNSLAFPTHRDIEQYRQLDGLQHHQQQQQPTSTALVPSHHDHINVTQYATALDSKHRNLTSHSSVSSESYLNPNLWQYQQQLKHHYHPQQNQKDQHGHHHHQQQHQQQQQHLQQHLSKKTTVSDLGDFHNLLRLTQTGNTINEPLMFQKESHSYKYLVQNNQKPLTSGQDSICIPGTDVENQQQANDIMDADVQFEDVDDDDISDFEEEEELRRNYELSREHYILQQKPNATSRLLLFADVISTELKKYFIRSKDQEDSCDVYEDKWATTKSGRELYYADLLRIAQGDMEPASKTVQKTSSSSPSSNSTSTTTVFSSSSLSTKTSSSASIPSSSTCSLSLSSLSSSKAVDIDNRCNFKGIHDSSVGMGLLSELFEYGLESFPIEKRKKSSNANENNSKATLAQDPSNSTSTSLSSSRSTPYPKRLKLDKSGSLSDKIRETTIIPMHDRNLPESFWKEPGLFTSLSWSSSFISTPSSTAFSSTLSSSTISSLPISSSSSLSSLPSASMEQPRFEMIPQAGMLTYSRLPDFSDLVESWQGNTERLDTSHNN